MISVHRALALTAILTRSSVATLPSIVSNHACDSTSRARRASDRLAVGSRCRIEPGWRSVMKTIVRLGFAAWLGLAARTSCAAADDQLFRDKVAPILERRCLHCHGEATHKGNLSLSTAAAVFKGGDSGPAVVPGKPEESCFST